MLELDLVLQLAKVLGKNLRATFTYILCDTLIAAKWLIATPCCFAGRNRIKALSWILINWEDAKRKQIDMKWKIIFEDNPSYLEISLEMEIERWIAVKAIFVSPVNPVHTL